MSYIKEASERTLTQRGNPAVDFPLIQPTQMAEKNSTHRCLGDKVRQKEESMIRGEGQGDAGERRKEKMEGGRKRWTGAGGRELALCVGR